MSGGPKYKSASYPKNQRSSNLSTSLYSTDFEDDEPCSNIDCPAKVNFEKSPGRKPTKKNSQNNKADQTPDRNDKISQKSGASSLSVKSQTEESQSESDISCHCFDDEDENSEGEEAPPPKKSPSKSKRGSKTGSTDESNGKNGRNGKNGDKCLCSQGSDDENIDCACAFDMTAHFLDVSGQVVFPCPTGWRMPQPQCDTCPPCSGIPCNLMFPPSIGSCFPRMPFLPCKCICGKVKPGCHQCKCVMKKAEEDDGEGDEDGDDDEGDGDEEEDDEDQQEEEQKPRKPSQSDRNKKSVRSPSRSPSRSSKRSEGKPSNGGREGGTSSGRKGPPPGVKVVKCEGKCRKCRK